MLLGEAYELLRTVGVVPVAEEEPPFVVLRPS